MATFLPGSTPTVTRDGCFAGSGRVVCSSISDTVFFGGGNGEEEKDTSFAIGVSVGVGVGVGVSVLAVAVLVIITVTIIVIKRTRKLTKEAPIYDFVTDKPLTQPERIELENITYESIHPQVYETPDTSPQAQPNIAYM